MRHGMYDKAMIVFEIIKQYGVLYEIASTVRNGGNPARKLGVAMERYNMVAGYTTNDDHAIPESDPSIERCADSASKMAIDFLEWEFNGAPEPEWAKFEQRVQGDQE